MSMFLTVLKTNRIFFSYTEFTDLCFCNRDGVYEQEFEVRSKFGILQMVTVLSRNTLKTIILKWNTRAALNVVMTCNLVPVA
jgi:hypothetical protein